MILLFNIEPPEIKNEENDPTRAVESAEKIGEGGGRDVVNDDSEVESGRQNSQNGKNEKFCIADVIFHGKSPNLIELSRWRSRTSKPPILLGTIPA